MEFVPDQLATGRRNRVLTVVDTFSRFLPGQGAREKLEVWRRCYTEDRPHGAIDNKPPITLMKPGDAPARHRDHGRETPTPGGPENGVGSTTVGLWLQPDERRGSGQTPSKRQSMPSDQRLAGVDLALDRQRRRQLHFRGARGTGQAAAAITARTLNLSSRPLQRRKHTLGGIASEMASTSVMASLAE